MEGQSWSITFRKIDEYPKIDSPKEQYLNDKDAQEICDELYPIIFSGSRVEKHGLIIIAGRTGTAKSKIARELLKRYLISQLGEDTDRKMRKPHVITFEDPIEKYLNASPRNAPRSK